MEKQITNIINYCCKCLKSLSNNYVKDCAGNKFCDKFCRSEYYIEIRQDNDDLLDYD